MSLFQAIQIFVPSIFFMRFDKLIGLIIKPGQRIDPLTFEAIHIQQYPMVEWSHA
jgi:hypothetical protein